MCCWLVNTIGNVCVCVCVCVCVGRDGWVVSVYTVMLVLLLVECLIK